MNETSKPDDQSSGQPKDAWQDVGREFEQLGSSIARAIRSAWNDAENRRRAKEMQTGLEAMIKEVGEAIRDTAQSPQGQQIRDGVIRAADTLVDVGEQTAQEIQPHLISALKQVNDELQKLVMRMENQAKSADESGDSNSTA